jgi:hypothetical protein
MDNTSDVSDALIDEFADWLDERCPDDADVFAGHAESFLASRAGAPLESIGDSDIGTFLLDWCPRQFTLPADRSREVCEAVAEFVLFLGSTGRLRGGPDRARTLGRTALGLAGTMQAKMADPTNYGMAKSLFAGIEGTEAMTQEELSAALQRRVDEHNALPIEQRRAATDQFFQPPAPIELPFLHIPPSEDEVAAAVAAAALPTKVQELRDYLGEKGKLLTAKGNLKLADGRALVDLLDTGDELDPDYGGTTFKTQSTQSLRQLMYLVTVAETSGAVRNAGNRVAPVKAWAKKSRVAQATKLFQTVVEFGVLSMMGGRVPFFDDVHGLLDDGVVHWLAGLIAPGARADFDDIVQLNKDVVGSQFRGDDADYYLSSESFAKDISRIVEILDMAGVVEWSDRQEALTTWRQRFWTGGTVSMTAFGRHVLPELLPAAGLVLRTAADLTEADLPELIAAMDTAPEQHHSAMLAAWKPTLAVAERAAIVAALITDAPGAQTRLIGLRLLGMFDADVAEPHMRQLLDTAAAGHAAIWLLDHGLADGDTVGGFITPAVLADILSLLVDDPEILCEQFLRSQDPDGMLEFFWRHPAPEMASVLDVLGRHLPDRGLAKQARKAAIKHRSWMANGGPR